MHDPYSCSDAPHTATWLGRHDFGLERKSCRYISREVEENDITHTHHISLVFFLEKKMGRRTPWVIISTMRQGERERRSSKKGRQRHRTT